TGYSYGLYIQTTTSYQYGVYGYNSYDYSYGLAGYTRGFFSAGVYGLANIGYAYGVYGYAETFLDNYGVYGCGSSHGVTGYCRANGTWGTLGSSTTVACGVYGYGGSSSYGVYGYSNNSSGVYGFGSYYGVTGYSGGYVTWGTLGSYNNGYPCGVYGSGGSSYYGMYGYTGSSSYPAIYGYGYYYGVYGYSSGYGLWGILASISGGYPAGVYGYGGSYYGVFGYSGSSLYCGVLGYGYYNGVMGYNSYRGIRGGLALYSPSSAVYGYANGYFGYYLVDVGGGAGNYSVNTSGYYCQVNYSSYKIYGSGSVSTYIIDANDRERALHCPEAPEVVFEDYGTAQLVNGRARVDIDPLFLRGVVINEEHPLRVYVTPNSDCNGLHVLKHDTYFEVIENNGGRSNVAFDWRIVANRAGYEHLRFEARERPADRRGKPEPTPANPWPEMAAPSVPVEPMPEQRQ
ncbi:MAG: hypothetical protein ABIK43_04720, partial [candidate division WOR-3 bacterium]